MDARDSVRKVGPALWGHGRWEAGRWDPGPSILTRLPLGRLGRHPRCPHMAARPPALLHRPLLGDPPPSGPLLPEATALLQSGLQHVSPAPGSTLGRGPSHFSPCPRPVPGAQHIWRYISPFGGYFKKHHYVEILIHSVFITSFPSEFRSSDPQTGGETVLEREAGDHPRSHGGDSTAEDLRRHTTPQSPSP